MTVTIVPVWVADILRNEGVTVTDSMSENLIAGECGIYSGVSFVVSSYEPPARKPKHVTHGPKRKGRGGKIKRW